MLLTLSRHPKILLSLSMLFWGISFPAMKYAIMRLDSGVLVCLRMCIGTLCLLPLVLGKGNLIPKRKDLGWIVAMVILEPFLYFIFETKGLELTTASQAGFISSILPILVTIGSVWFLGETINFRSIAGMLLAFGGIALLTITSDSNEYAPNPLVGNIFEFFAMLSAAGFTLILKKLSGTYGPLALTFYQTVAGAILFSPALFWGDSNLQVVWSDPTLLVVILLLGSVVTVVAYLCYIEGMRKTPANQAIIFVNLIPVFSLFFSVIWLSETMNLLQCISIVFVIGGVVYSQSNQKKPRAIPSQA